MGILRACTFLVLATPLASCVPAPHVEHLRPAVSGVLVENGKPIPGAGLYLGKYAGNTQPCTEVGEVVPVSPQGGFAWTAIEEFRLADSLLNPVAQRGALTVLCIRHPAKGVLIGAVLFMKQQQPVSLRLACDAAHPRSGVDLGPNVTSAMLGQVQHCQASNQIQAWRSAP